MMHHPLFFDSDSLICHTTQPNTALLAALALTLKKLGYMADIHSLTSSTNLVWRWNGSLWTILLKLSALLISSRYPMDSKVCSQSFNLSANASSPTRFHGLSGGPSVNLVTYFKAIVKGCPNHCSNRSLAFRYPRDESMNKQHLIVFFATPDVY